MTTRAALLDVNVLVALFFPDHVHHELAHDWFEDHQMAGQLVTFDRTIPLQAVRGATRDLIQIIEPAS